MEANILIEAEAKIVASSLGYGPRSKRLALIKRLGFDQQILHQAKINLSHPRPKPELKLDGLGCFLLSAFDCFLFGICC